MSRLSSSWVLILVLGLGTSAFAGCGGDEGAPVYNPGGSRDGGGDGDGDADGDAGVDPLAPFVEILAPESASDPNEDDVLVDGEVTVRCRVTMGEDRGARDIDVMSISIQHESKSESGDTVVTEGVVKAADSADEFEATFALAAVPSGPTTFRCTASDVAEPARTTTASRSTLVDHGPKVTFLEPVDESTFPLGTVLVRFRVEPDPLSDDDAEAEVEDVSFTVLGRDDFAPVQDPEDASLYTAMVDFTRDDVFTMPPSSAGLMVTATNKRTPKAAERSERVNIVIDSEPPTIAIVEPKNLDIVRGEVVLTLTITDDSGIDADTVAAVIEPTDVILTEWEVTGDTYTASFDTRDVMFSELVQLTINIEARDSAGNGAEVGIALRLDNVPPLISLDPPLIREWRMGPVDMPYFCSAAFDPVGEAVGDLGSSEESSLYRALVFERTNSTPGVVVNYPAGIEESSVAIYAQGNPDIPLLIDTNGDGKCDEIAVDQADDDDEPVLLQLSPLNASGSAHFPMSLDDPGNVAESFCEAVPTPEAVPAPLCLATEMTRIIHGRQSDNPPAIYAFAPDATACAGNSWANLLTIVGEGWACLAGRAEDNIGNVGVSRAIRVCFDDQEGVPACDPINAASAPSCMDDCTPPDDLQMNYTHRQ